MSKVSRWSDAGTPILDDGERRAMAGFWKVYDAHYDELQAESMAAASVHPEFGAVLRSMPNEQLAAQQARSRHLLRGALVDGQWEPYMTDLRTQGGAYARMGISFTAWFDLVNTFNRSLLGQLFKAYGSDLEQLKSAIAGMMDFIDIVLSAIGESYLSTKERVIGQQQSAIRELSTPVLQIVDRLLLLPIIGVVDTQRARQLTEHMLKAIRSHRARVVVMDVTGVPAVDSKVANHFLQTVTAARLMGATVIVTGLSAEVAQTLVTLGVDLARINTAGDLQAGLEEARRILGLQVSKVGEAASRNPAGAA